VGEGTADAVDFVAVDIAAVDYIAVEAFDPSVVAFAADIPGAVAAEEADLCTPLVVGIVAAGRDLQEEEVHCAVAVVADADAAVVDSFAMEVVRIVHKDFVVVPPAVAAAAAAGTALFVDH